MGQCALQDGGRGPRAFFPGGKRTEPFWGVWKDIVSVMIKGTKLDKVVEIQREGKGAQAQILCLP